MSSGEMFYLDILKIWPCDLTKKKNYFNAAAATVHC